MSSPYGVQQSASSGEANPATTAAKSKLHDVLRHLVITLASAQPLDALLQSLATLTMQALGVDLCVLLLMEQSQQQLKLHTWTPDLSDKHVDVQAVNIDNKLLERFRMALQSGQLPRLALHELEMLNPLKNVQYETLLPVPLIVGDECVGLMLCYSSKSLSVSEDDQLMLTTIANQAGLTIKNRQLVAVDMLTQNSLVSMFLDALFSSTTDAEALLFRRASALGWNLSKTSIVAVIEITQDGQQDLSEERRHMLHRSIFAQVKRSLLQHYPGSLVDERPHSLLCLLCPGNDADIEHVDEWLNQLLYRVQSEHMVSLSAGISTPCRAVSDYQRGYAEANQALEIGQCLRQDGSCTSFDQLGVYRYLYTFARTDTLCDQYQHQIASIAEYDRRRKTNLLDTLEVYLETGGNITRTSGVLNVHRNTLLQRLDRMQVQCSLDLEEHTSWLPLLVALKVHKLRAGTVHDT